MPTGEVWIYSILSVLFVSVISLIGLFTISVKTEKLNKFVIYLVSLSAGALFGGAFLHLLPELLEETSSVINVSFFILGGIVLFFFLEKVIHWHHCHIPHDEERVHSFAIMNLIGDGFHNFLDGVIVGAAYLVSLPVGFAATIAVILHEIPQEIGDFGVLIHGGFSKSRALFFNFLSALVSVVGVVFALVLSNYVTNVHLFLVPIAIGGFIYIAGSDLIPELNKHFTTKKAIIQLISFIVGILLMAALLLLE